jgi:hypothetical protein
VRHDRVGLAERQVSLVEIVDRALGSGVVITGDLTISLADVDLVYLNLRLLVGSVGTILEAGGDATGGEVVPVGSH